MLLDELEDIRPYNEKTDRDAAFLFDDESFEGYSWIFNRIIPIVPFPVKGKLHLFEVNCEIDDLEIIDIDYSLENSPNNLVLWWKDNGFIDETRVLLIEEE